MLDEARHVAELEYVAAANFATLADREGTSGDLGSVSASEVFDFRVGAGMYASVSGRYALGAVIASGGMGEVRIGNVVGARGFRRVVAVKCVKPPFSNDAGFVSMLRDEAHVVSNIHHGNVAAVLDLVEDASGLFLIMGYIHGDSLATLDHRSTASQQDDSREHCVDDHYGRA